MNKVIESFEVIGLFGTDDVSIPFKDTVKILIGENRIGKTQGLNLLYYTITENEYAQVFSWVIRVEVFDPTDS